MQELVRNIKGYLLRNRIPFCEYDRPLDILNGVGIHYFKSYRTDGKENFGDALSPIVIEWMLNRKNIQVERKCGGGYEETSLWHWLYPLLGLPAGCSMGKRNVSIH